MAIELACHICGRSFDVDRRDMLRLPLATYRACPACRDVAVAPCEVVWSTRGRYWAVTVPDCPHCHKRHYHGGGTDPQRVDLGHRAPHCIDNHTDGYELVETPASIEERARKRAKAVAA